ncbi:pre-mRNA-splicing factor syf1 [Scheffersomyces spartinae]|uniref:Pre-mRNA-splicing factor SYF1 n=1 Tax=Scheffersomyces spartinae TaxID=45513 RepID=A0A9P7VA30_9ASCO|nr:pre-mRNA-splicing factor syf1 [Scheffersomyces spartinae]KAG7193613.1 pre-mRNA-splicing factor syf1 [Scheffersomyces spartinae]
MSEEQFLQRCTEITDINAKLHAFEEGVSRWPQLKPVWTAFIKTAVEDANIQDEETERVYQQAVTSLVTDSEVWVEYLAFLIGKSTDISWIRLKFNQALMVVPLEEHLSIWKQYLRFADKAGGLTGTSIVLRYLEYATDEDLNGKVGDPELWTIDQVILKLAEFGDTRQLLLVYTRLSRHFTRLGLYLKRTKIQIWSEMMELFLGKNYGGNGLDEKIETIAFLLSKEFPDQEATVHLKLALYFMSLLQDIGKVRHLFDLGIKTCKTVKDFVLLYDTYTGFEERLLTKRLDAEEDEGDYRQLDLRMHKLEQLLDSRHLMMNDVLLRLDPNNIDYWFDRLEIVKEDMNSTLETYVKAISTINPLKYVSYNNHNLPELWINYSKVYSSNGDTTTAELIFSKAVESQYKSSDELAQIYISWCDLLLEMDCDIRAIQILDDILKDLSQAKIASNLKVWEYYIDLIESGVTEGDESQINTVVNAYERMITRKVATVVNILGYAMFLSAWGYHERAFSVYEHGLRLFKLEPTIKFEIWNVYLAKLMSSSLSAPERIRDVFNQCIDDLPGKFLKPIIILAADFEAKTMNSVVQAIKCLQRGATLVPDSKDKGDIFRLLIAKLDDLNDPSEYRRYMEQIINDNNKELALMDLVDFIQAFIDFETSQNQYPRVRQLYMFVTGLTPPKLLQSTWSNWEKFEVAHGNVETYKAMLKHKRKLTKAFEDKPIANPMGFIKSDQVKGGEIKQELEPAAVNPDIIDMDMD